MRANHHWLCNTPTDKCMGSTRALNAGLRGASKKAHSSPEAAYDCYKRYLISTLGYSFVGNHSFSPPNNDGPILVITKRSRYGGHLRPGKTEGGAAAKRSNPKARKKNNRGGIIVG